MRMILRKALTDESSRLYRQTTTALALCTLVSVVAVAAETIPTFSRFTGLFIVIERFTIGIFTLEYGLRIWIAPRAREYVFSYLGILDLASILPTYLGAGSLTFLRSVRMIRTLRFIRIIGRANISHVQNKGEELSRDFALSAQAVLSIFIGGIGVCMLLYTFFIDTNIPLFEMVNVFSGFVDIPNTLGYGGATLIMLARVLGALGIGFGIGICIKMATEKFNSRKYY